jgi:hypothetical protein
MGNGQGGEYADDEHDDHQLEEREACVFLAIPVH